MLMFDKCLENRHYGCFHCVCEAVEDLIPNRAGLDQDFISRYRDRSRSRRELPGN
jgi:hypothetical protein